MKEIRNVSKRYGDKIVLAGVFLQFSTAAPNIIMGPSGCGKTTLIRIIADLERADSGDLSDFKGMTFSAVFQEDRLCNGISAFKNVRLVCDISDVSDEELLDMFAQVGLSQEDAHTSVFELSGGMSRRAAIVRAMAANSDVVILDEPFKGLDEDNHIRAAEFVQRNLKNRMMIMVTHDFADMEFFGGNLIEFS